MPKRSGSRRARARAPTRGATASGFVGAARTCRSAPRQGAHGFDSAKAPGVSSSFSGGVRMTKKVGATDSSAPGSKATPPSVRSGTRTAQRPPPIPGAAAKPPPIPGASAKPSPEREGLGKSASSQPARSRPPAALPPRPRAASPTASPLEANQARPATSSDPRSHQIESIGRGLGELHALLATVAAELEALRAAERALSAAGSRKLHELASTLRRAAGQAPSVRPAARPNGPPPIPAFNPSSRPSSRPRAPMRSTMDISEIAELVESMAPPPLEPLPSVDIDDESW